MVAVLSYDILPGVVLIKGVKCKGYGGVKLGR
jgi:hypothetical protein